ncbi:unnamed protein product [Urochloa decumbens]|uniref:[RNA-polymerase]-subunit kinase n=1 Tax=Urochloa decumbens TaxID=240449 RepID=A0ABC8Y144_9POAL
MAAACVEAPAGVARHHAAAQPAARKRMRVAMGSTDDYDFEDAYRLGEGTFGAVIRARHRGTGQAVAMKFLGDDGGGHEALLRKSLLLEAASAGNQFVVGSHGLARDPATWELCLVMDYGGSSLRDALRRQPGPLPESTVRAAMWELLTGAKGMHAAHIMHRDIKPHNILLGDDRVLRLCDLGLAVHMSEPPPYGKAGTLWYMAPEVLLGKPDYDALVDVWSLGCVMAELVTGKAPFRGEDEEDQLCAIFGVLGFPDDTTWPWFASTQFAAELPELDDKQRKQGSVLHSKFPETRLSKEGFDLLSGLLACNPDKRLTAAAALKHPWFSRMD